MRISIVAIIILACIPNVAAQEIGLVVPLSGDFAKVGQNIKNGFLHAAEEKYKGQEIEFKIVDDQCEAKNVTRKINELKNTKIIVGPVCFDVAVEMAKEMKLQKLNIPIITLDTRNSQLTRLREYDELPIYELSPAPNEEAVALFNYTHEYLNLTKMPFALVDDGGVRNRGLVDAIRLIGEEKFIRPRTSAQLTPLQENQYDLIEKMQEVGVKVLIVAADEYDIEVMLNDIAELEAEIIVVTNEYANHIDAENLLVIHSQLSQTAQRSALENTLKPLDRTEAFIEGYTLLEIALEVVESNKTQDRFIEPFETILGKLIFDNGRANPRPFVVKKYE